MSETIDPGMSDDYYDQSAGACAFLFTIAKSFKEPVRIPRPDCWRWQSGDGGSGQGHWLNFPGNPDDPMILKSDSVCFYHR
jgi:hypothetical protein